MALIYDMVADEDREITQAEVDKLQRTAAAFSELVKRIQFYDAEVRNGLILPGLAMHDIVNAMKEVKGMADTLSLDELIQNPVHGRHVLVVER